MAVNPCTIQNCSFQATIAPSVVTPLSAPLLLSLPLNFANCSNVQLFNGNFTPLNNYLYLFQAMPASLAPDFMMVLADAQLNIQAGFTGGSTLQTTINRFLFWSCVWDAANFMQSLLIDGRTNSPTPMVQDQKVDYSVIIGNGTIS